VNSEKLLENIIIPCYLICIIHIFTSNKFQMKTIILSLLSFILISGNIIAQDTKYQTFKAQLKLIGQKDDQKYQWDNNKLTVALDYKTGNFISKFKNTDFISENDPVDYESIETKEIILRGVFPIEAIIHQKAINAKYNVELELETEEGSYILNFNVDITRPNTGQGSYRVFLMDGIIYNDQTNFPRLKELDNEINLIIAFNGFSNN